MLMADFSISKGAEFGHFVKTCAGDIGGGLSCSLVDSSRGCGIVLLGSNGSDWLEMLVFSKVIELDHGHQ